MHIKLIIYWIIITIIIIYNLLIHLYKNECSFDCSSSMDSTTNDPFSIKVWFIEWEFYSIINMVEVYIPTTKILYQFWKKTNNNVTEVKYISHICYNR